MHPVAINLAFIKVLGQMKVHAFMSKYLFYYFSNPLVSCDSSTIPRVDLMPWKKQPSILTTILKQIRCLIYHVILHMGKNTNIKNKIRIKLR